MRNFIKLFFVALLLAPGVSLGQEFGLGFMIGNPTGVSVRKSLGSHNSVDGALGWSLGDDVDYHIHGDYLWHRPQVVDIDNILLDFYFGIGARLKDRDTDNNDDDEIRLGARVPAGLNYMFTDPSIEIFGELALILDVIESTAVDLNIAVGARYWF